MLMVIRLMVISELRLEGVSYMLLKGGREEDNLGLLVKVGRVIFGDQFERLLRKQLRNLFDDGNYRYRIQAVEEPSR